MSPYRAMCIAYALAIPCISAAQSLESLTPAPEHRVSCATVDHVLARAAKADVPLLLQAVATMQEELMVLEAPAERRCRTDSLWSVLRAASRPPWHDWLVGAPELLDLARAAVGGKLNADPNDRHDALAARSVANLGLPVRQGGTIAAEFVLLNAQASEVDQAICGMLDASAVEELRARLSAASTVPEHYPTGIAYALASIGDAQSAPILRSQADRLRHNGDDQGAALARVLEGFIARIELQRSVENVVAEISRSPWHTPLDVKRITWALMRARQLGVPSTQLHAQVCVVLDGLKSQCESGTSKTSVGLLRAAARCVRKVGIEQEVLKETEYLLFAETADIEFSRDR